ncbi:proton-coupled amino acid transporter 2-like isoform X2 [Pieris napi]|uniref:proton-coupled amino acid transporter 2-like isoform X2 n=1 Tax=Pieris napi TaxID=78633 RepID=UPI001FB9352F|nr:proton-coupled amino acid transporter 2-like isoform X2 [Pieris napi]
MELSEKQSKNYVDHGDPPESKYTHSNNEQKEYDFVANRPVRKRNNLFEAVGHFVKSCLGGGILGIHEAFMKCGLWTALFVSIIFGIYISYCLHMLVSAAQKLCKQLHVPEMSYPDVAEASLEVCPFPSLRRYSKWFSDLRDCDCCVRSQIGSPHFHGTRMEGRRGFL